MIPAARTYHVIFRACDAISSVHRVPRPFGLEKQTLIKICFLSLYDSLKTVPHQVTVLGDNLSEPLRSFFAQFPVQLDNRLMGNDRSIRESVEIARALPDDHFVYFCEDDYLHRPETFLWIDDLLEHRADIFSYVPRRKWMKLFVDQLNNKPLFIFPPDYPDRYAADQRKHSFVFFSQYCHWRQVTNTTFTFLTQAIQVKRYYKTIIRSSRGANDAYLSRNLYGRLLFLGRGLCVSPLPALSAHMHQGVLPPFVDWQTLCNRYKARLEHTEFGKLPKA